MFILILAANFIIGAAAILAAFPCNQVAVVGSKVILECRTNTSKKLIWKQRPLNETEKDGLLEIIFTGNQFSTESTEKYDIIRESAGQFDLKFNATLNHGNEYMCIEPGGYNFSSQIIVLASEPKCYVNGMPVTFNSTVVYEEELIELKCNLTFTGRWTPKMEWTQQVISENDWMIIADQEVTEKTDKIYSTSATLGFNATHNETSFVCTTRFLEYDRPKTTTAENIPEYSYNWTSPTFVLRSFYESNYTKQEIEHKDENIEMKGVFVWVSAALVLSGLLCIAVIVTVKLKTSKVQQPTVHNPSQPSTNNPARPATHSLVVVAIYSDVKEKSVKRTEDPPTNHLGCELQEPVIYSEVYNPGTAQTGHACPQQVSAQCENSCTITGADGTEYSLLPVFQSQQPLHQMKTRKDIFETSVYAPIDHTHTIVPPPPK